MTIDGVEVVRSGTALAVRAGGRTRLIRWIDLAAQLGAPDPRRSRFAGARLASGGIEVDLAGGGRERVAIEEPSVVVVETSGLVMLSDPRGEDHLGMILGGALVAVGGRVEWVGKREDLTRSGIDLRRAHRVDAGGRLVTPGLVDCHAHPIFAGDRSDEFARRAAGQTYLETVRQASESTSRRASR